MESEIKKIDERLIRLTRDMEIIKGLLMQKVDDEGEISEWAKNELKEVRKEGKDKRIFLKDLKKEIEDEL